MIFDEKLVVDIIKSVTKNLFYVNKELCPINDKNYFSQKIIFPLKRQKKNIITRISEQELRLLFCQELFKKKIYFSIETPTQYKYKLSENYDRHSFILDGKTGQSASIDTTIFNYLKNENRFNRILNIEFKHKGDLLGISKDVLKLFAEDESALFLHLLNNSNRGTFTNENEKCLFKKYVDSTLSYKSEWNNKLSTKFIIFSFIILKKKMILYKKFSKNDLNGIESFFYEKMEKNDDEEFINNGWKLISMNINDLVTF